MQAAATQWRNTCEQHLLLTQHHIHISGKMLSLVFVTGTYSSWLSVNFTQYLCLHKSYQLRESVYPGGKVKQCNKNKEKLPMNHPATSWSSPLKETEGNFTRNFATDPATLYELGFGNLWPYNTSTLHICMPHCHAHDIKSSTHL